MKKILSVIYLLCICLICQFMANAMEERLVMQEKTRITSVFDLLPAELIVHIMSFLMDEASIGQAIINVKRLQCNRRMREILRLNTNYIIDFLKKRSQIMGVLQQNYEIYIAALLGTEGSLEWLKNMELENFTPICQAFLSLFYQAKIPELDLVVIRNLLQYNKILISVKDSVDGNNALMISVNNNNLKLLDSLLKFLGKNFDIFQKDKIMTQLNNSNLNIMNLAAQIAKEKKLSGSAIVILLVNFANVSLSLAGKDELFMNTSGKVSPLYDVKSNFSVSRPDIVSLLLNNGAHFENNPHRL